MVQAQEKRKVIPQQVVDWNESLTLKSAEERVAWALAEFNQGLIMTSSFGIQAAVMLHLVTTQAPQMPVVLIDTGYFFPETYRFIDQLQKRLDLNLRIYRSEMSSAWQEARYGKLWEKGLEGLQQYNLMNKVEPMNRALKELGVKAWLAGLRRQQASTRKELRVVEEQHGRWKIHPIIDWTDRDVFMYLKKYELPYHPLWDEGYLSMGDWHTTRKPTGEMTEEETRFFGLKRECGLHTDVGNDFAI
jgi:phosphoadenosine phosphosulfate reductase